MCVSLFMRGFVAILSKCSSFIFVFRDLNLSNSASFALDLNMPNLKCVSFYVLSSFNFPLLTDSRLSLNPKKKLNHFPGSA